MDELLRKLKKQFEEFPADLSLKEKYFNALIRSGKGNMETQYKIRNIQTGQYLSPYRYSRLKFSDRGKTFKTRLEALKCIESIADSQTQTQTKNLPKLELVEFGTQIVELSLETIDLSKVSRELKLQKIREQKKKLEDEERKLLG